MGMINKKRCRHCRRLFIPDYRNRDRQKYCKTAMCRKTSKAASQEKWLNKPENKNYFRGPVNVQRVQEWRRQNPEYWKPKNSNKGIALQEPLTPQPSEINPIITGACTFKRSCNALFAKSLLSFLFSDGCGVKGSCNAIALFELFGFQYPGFCLRHS